MFSSGTRGEGVARSAEELRLPPVDRPSGLRPHSGQAASTSAKSERLNAQPLTYDYHAADGRLLYQVVRTAQKRFWVQRPSPSGGWEPGLGEAPRVLYRLPELVAAPEGSLVFVVEGEKDVESLRSLALVATTNMSGAGKWEAASTPAFVGKRVVVLPDNDAPGLAHAQKVLTTLLEAGVEAVTLVLPGLPPKGDVSDWLAAGGTREELLERAEAALAAGVELYNSTPSSGEAAGGELYNSTPAGSRTAGWPAPLAEAAFHGIAGDVVRTLEPHTEADPAALLLCFLAAMGNLLGRGPHTTVEAARHGLNLFVAVVGRSSKSRKGTAFLHVEALLKAIEPRWVKERLCRGIASGEAIISTLRDPEDSGLSAAGCSLSVTAPARTAESGQPTVIDKRLLIVESEFMSFLTKMGSDGSTLSGRVRCAWDGAPLENVTKSSSFKASDTHISFIVNITGDELRSGLKVTESFNGFANRFLWVYAKRSKLLPFGGDLSEEEYAALIDRLAQAWVKALVVERVTWSAAARPLWVAVYEALSAEEDGLVGAIIARGEAQVLRLATLYAVLDGSSQIEPEHLRAALAVWEYCEASARFLFSHSTGQPLADQIAAALQAAPAGLSRTDLRERVGKNTTNADLDEALARLAAAGWVTHSKRPKTGAGRPPEVWVWARPALPADPEDGTELEDGVELYNSPPATSPEDGVELYNSAAEVAEDGVELYNSAPAAPSEEESEATPTRLTVELTELELRLEETSPPPFRWAGH